MNKKFQALLMTALICGSFAITAQAQEAEPSFELDPMVVTASRYEKKDLDTAAAVEVFDQQRIADIGAANAYEILQFGTGMEIQQYGTGGASMGNMTSKITIRGNKNGTLVLVNGMPLNIRGTYDLNDIPAENIERIEIVRGGGAVLYGSEATGGVINIITKENRANFIKAALGNYGQQQYSGSFQADRLGFGYNYSKWDKRYNVDNSGRIWQGPENNNFDLSYKFSDQLTLMASHNESSYHYITPNGKTPKDTKQNVRRNNIQLKYDDAGWTATAYYVDRNREKDEINLKNNKRSTDEENNKNYGLDLQKVYDFGNSGKALFGANYKMERYTPDGAAEQSRHNYSVYGQYEKAFDDKNSVVISARESWTGGAPNGYNNDNFSGQVQYVHKLDDTSSLYASVGQSYKMPDLHQIYKTKAGADLKAQTGTHYEIGMKKQFDDYRTAKLSVFNYRIEDNISATYDDTLLDFTYENENLKNTGVELEYRYAGDNGWGYHANVSYSNPKTQEINADGVDFGWQENYAKLQAGAGINYHKDKWTAALTATYSADRSTYKNEVKSGVKKTTRKEVKPYLLTNLHVEYKPESNISIYGTVNNLFDRKDISYFSTSSEYYVTPFNYVVGVKYSF